MRPLSPSRRAKALLTVVLVGVSAAVVAWPRDGHQSVAVRTENRPGTDLPPLPGTETSSTSPTSTDEETTTSTTVRATTTSSGSTPVTTRKRPPTTVTTKPATTSTSIPVALPLPTTTITTGSPPTTRPQNPKAPRALSMTVSPKEIDTSAGPVKITVRLQMVDEQGDASTDGTSVRFTNGNSFQDVPYAAWKLQSGDASDGIYEATFDVYQHSAQGHWKVAFIHLTDQALNDRYEYLSEIPDADFDDGFLQTGPGDPDPPRLRELTIVPQGASVTFTARITDGPAGVATTSDDPFDSMAFVVSPTGKEYYVRFGWSQIIAGTKLDATYRFVLSLGPTAEPGTWTVRQVHMGDIISNQTNLWTADLAAAGFPTTFVVSP